MKQSITITTHVLLLTTCVIFSTLRAQTPTNYYGALEYSLTDSTAGIPSYTGEPVGVTAAYLLFDMAMKQSGWDQTDKFIANMGYGDTAKYVIGMLYRVMDDNPVAFGQWVASSYARGNHHIDVTGHALTSLKYRISQICPDSARTAMLLDDDIIADVRVIDTSGVFDPTALLAKHMIGVTCTILDSIKGRYVPACPEIYKAHKENRSPQSAATPIPTYATPASPGTCLQFEYFHDAWRTGYQGDMGPGSNPLYDSVNGAWIKPDSEYIVFLSFLGVGHDSTHYFFSIGPNLDGSSAGMYPVHGGIVYDPNDDYNMGAAPSGGSPGLAVAEWKRRLRARIALIANQ